MILSHFSAGAFRLDKGRAYKQVSPPHNLKCKGLWLSDESTEHGWKWWCEGNDFALDRLAVETKFRCDTSRWAVLTDNHAIREFHWNYAKEVFPGLRYIDWPAVAGRYAGILISPYSWELRLAHDFLWYYGWDCASACVWDLSTIEEESKEEK